MPVAATLLAPCKDRRIARRYQPAMGTVCHLSTDTGENMGMGLVWNISRGGVSLLICEPIEPGTPLQGELSTMNGQQKLPIQLEVAHLSKLLTGDYCIGARFNHEIDDQTMRPFVGETIPSAQ